MSAWRSTCPASLYRRTAPLIPVLRKNVWSQSLLALNFSSEMLCLARNPKALATITAPVTVTRCDRARGMKPISSFSSSGNKHERIFSRPPAELVAGLLSRETFRGIVWNVKMLSSIFPRAVWCPTVVCEDDSLKGCSVAFFFGFSLVPPFFGGKGSEVRVFVAFRKSYRPKYTSKRDGRDEKFVLGVAW